MKKQIAIAAGLGLAVGGLAFYYIKTSKRQTATAGGGASSSSSGGVVSQEQSGALGGADQQMQAPIYPIKIGEHEVTEEQVKEMLSQAIEAKKMGNDLLGKGQFDEA
eukprot:369619_1